ncbi:MAG: hypothetical protein QM742_04290 [Aquabacterium sp.]
MSPVPSSFVTWLRSPWLVGLAGLLMAGWFTQMHGQQAEQFLEWRDFVNFVGEHPFQARVLPFVMARIANAFHRLGSLGLFNFFLTVDFIATFAAFMLVWKAAWKVLDDARGVLIAMVLFWWQMWVTFVFSPVHNYYYPYDMMSVAFVAAGVWMTVSGQGLKPMLMLLVLAMLNRETAVVLPFFYLAWHGVSSRRVLAQVLLMLLLCVGIKLGISHMLRAYDEMASLEHVPGLPRYIYNFTFVTLKPEFLHTANAFLALGMLWLALPLPGQADTRLKRMMWCFVPYLAGMAVVGNLSEIRIFAEFIPLVALLLASKWSVRGQPSSAH